ncbi:MAG: hypothetical protein IPG55_11680 [Saprospiraceae bacterium]|nr:hypothetical protein [Candidatus Defluviibacterium haderslevense]MBK7244228.1 hypothetical protein [Candidatus Defluviibacterium haderslevense]
MTYSLNQHTIGILVQLGVKMYAIYQRYGGFKNPSIWPLASNDIYCLEQAL